MKVLAALTSLVAIVSAAPLEQRQATQYDITNFTANTIVGAAGAVFGFNIDIPGALSTVCSYSDSTSGSRLPDVVFRPCSNPAVEWQFRRIEEPGFDLYLIVITYADPSGRKVGGFKEWDRTQFPVVDQEQSYVGAPDFVISNLS